MAYASSQQHQQQQQYTMEHHREPEKPLVYEPPDLQGRKHVKKGIAYVQPQSVQVVSVK